MQVTNPPYANDPNYKENFKEFEKSPTTSKAGGLIKGNEVAAHFRRLGVPVVMGGIHATMCLEEVMERVDSVVTGEARGHRSDGFGGRTEWRTEAPV